MRTTKLIIGIFSIVLSVFITFQSLVAGLGNTIMNNGEVSGSAGLLVSIFMLVGGIVVLVTQKRRSIAPVIIYTISGLIGLILAGSYTDLYIWSSLNLIFAVILFFANRQSKPNRRRVVKEINNDYEEYDDEVITESRSRQKSSGKNNNWMYVVIAILLVGFADLFFDFSGLGILDDISGNSNSAEVTSSEVEDITEVENEFGNTIETDDFAIEILDVWLETNEFTNEEIIVFEYDITNKRDDPTGNDTDWLLTMSAVQDNSDDVVNTLNYSSPKDYGVEKFAQVKPGGTTTYGQGYVLTDMKTPVTLTAQEFLGETIWEKEFDIIDLNNSNNIEAEITEDDNEEDIVAMSANIKRSKGKFINIPKLAKLTEESTVTETAETPPEEVNTNNSASTNNSNNSGYTDADIAYWNSIANQYGFQSFGGQSDFASYVEYAQSAVQNAEVYGTPYPELEYINPPAEENLQTYIEDEYGNMYENPIYENRYGPEESEYESYE